MRREILVTVATARRHPAPQTSPQKLNISGRISLRTTASSAAIVPSFHQFTFAGYRNQAADLLSFSAAQKGSFDLLIGPPYNPRLIGRGRRKLDAIRPRFDWRRGGLVTAPLDVELIEGIAGTVRPSACS
jgi:hypothetical protein